MTTICVESRCDLKYLRLLIDDIIKKEVISLFRLGRYRLQKNAAELFRSYVSKNSRKFILQIFTREQCFRMAAKTETDHQMLSLQIFL